MHADPASTSTCAGVGLRCVSARSRCAQVPQARSAGVEDFYKGKTVTLLIGYSVGGGYDLYGRLLARHSASTFPAIPASCRRT